MYPSDLIGGLDRLRQQAARAAASTVSLAKPAAGAAVAGLASTVSLAKPAAGAAVSGLASTVSLAKPAAGAAVAVTRHAAGMFSTREGAVKTAAVVVGGAVGAYFLWPTAAVAASATMKAPGAAGFLISRAAFVANPQLYFQILRTAGTAAAAAAFAV